MKNHRAVADLSCDISVEVLPDVSPWWFQTKHFTQLWWTSYQAIHLVAPALAVIAHMAPWLSRLHTLIATDRPPTRAHPLNCVHLQLEHTLPSWLTYDSMLQTTNACRQYWTPRTPEWLLLIKLMLQTLQSILVSYLHPYTGMGAGVSGSPFEQPNFPSCQQFSIYGMVYWWRLTSIQCFNRFDIWTCELDIFTYEFGIS